MRHDTMEQSQATLGAAIVVLGGLLHGSFALPLRRIRKWQWENTWLVYSVVATFLFPLLLAALTVPSLFTVYANTPGSTILRVALFGFGWGVGSTLFGQGISRVGMALGFAIVLGITSSLGSLLPLLILNPEQIGTRKGMILLLGLAIVVAGIIACAVAGAVREKDQKGSAAAATQGSFTAGLLICIASGVLSPMLNFGFVFGDSIRQAATNLGARPDLAGNALWAPAMLGGFLANAGYSIWLLNKNKTWTLYRSPDAPASCWWGAILMGVLWFGGISLYGMGASSMGPWGGVLGWPVFMSMVIVTANVHGALGGEWAGASATARALSWLGIAVLIAAIAVISTAA
jgi:L-rhamnose-H+ transport protein